CRLAPLHFCTSRLRSTDNGLSTAFSQHSTPAEGQPHSCAVANGAARLLSPDQKVLSQRPDSGLGLPPVASGQRLAHWKRATSDLHPAGGTTLSPSCDALQPKQTVRQLRCYSDTWDSGTTIHLDAGFAYRTVPQVTAMITPPLSLLLAPDQNPE